MYQKFLQLFIFSLLISINFACVTDYECPRNQYCGPDGYCKVIQHSLSSIGGNHGAYYLCSRPSECRSGELCDNGRCIPNAYLQSSYKRCTISLQCGNAETCYNGQCVSTLNSIQSSNAYVGTCLIDAQCYNKDERCINNQCQIVMGIYASNTVVCQVDSDCPTSQTCIASRCSTSNCRTDRDCPNQLICIQGTCIDGTIAASYQDQNKIDIRRSSGTSRWGAVCRYQTDCPNDKRCFGGYCIRK